MSAAVGMDRAAQQRQSELREQLVAYIKTTSEATGGAADFPPLFAKFASHKAELLPILNDMHEQNTLEVEFYPNGKIARVWLKSEIAANKLRGLGDEAKLVYQVIRAAADKGIWTKDIKMKTNVAQQPLTKALKMMESRQLIKSVKGVDSKTRKLYMLFELQASKEVSGGPWYNADRDFDHEYVEQLQGFTLDQVVKKKRAHLHDLEEQLRLSGFSNEQLSVKEFQTLVNSLVYDGVLEEIPNIPQRTREEQGPMYKAVTPVVDRNHFTDMPCGRCPVIDQCCPGGVVSPETCMYMMDWLNKDMQF